MPETLIDLRSDTVTRPSLAMRQAMATAEVGDDVLGADPTTARLERRIAEMLGKPSALYMPSGTMTNQIAIRVHCCPGDEFLCEADCHIYNYEQGAFAQLTGVVARTVKGHEGGLKREDLEPLVRASNEHFVRTRLVCLENTHGRSGGRVLPLSEVRRLTDWARGAGIRTHLDGARLFNAVVASGVSAADWASGFDTVSVCFSKGLGAPVGSALVGTEDAIRSARRHRKLFGGGMRQCGIIAAGALFALDHHIERLADDHEKARALASEIDQAQGLSVAHDVETNIVFIKVDPAMGSARKLVADLERSGVLMLAESEQTVRALTHLDVSREQVVQAGRILQQLADAAGRSLV